MGYESKIYLAGKHRSDLRYLEYGTVGERGELIRDWSVYGGLTPTVENPGYETKILVGHIDLSKAGYDSAVSGLIRDSIATAQQQSIRPAFYLGDDELTVEDKYGDPIAFVDLAKLLSALEEAQARTPYRRFELAIPFLREALAQGWIAAYHYGH